MKKIIILTTILLLTGCSKTLTCSSKGSSEKSTITQTYKINYEENKVKNIKVEKTYQFEDEQTFKNFENVLKFTVQAKNNENITSSYKSKNKKYTLSEKYNVEKLDDETLIQNGLSSDLEQLKQTLKNNGLECK